MRTSLTTLVLILAAFPAAAETPAPMREDAGAYLAARTAAADSNYREATGWFTRALAVDADNLQLLNGAMISAMGTGDFDTAAAHAARMAELGDRIQLGALARVAADARNGRFAEILAAQDKGASGGNLFDKLVGAWAEAGSGQMSEALEAFDTTAKMPGAALFAQYHKALALASVGDFESADEILARKEMAPLHTIRRAVLAHAQILAQLERGKDAMALLDTAFPQGQDPAADELRRRIEVGEPVTYDIAVNAQQGLAEAFYTMAVALNGEANGSFTLIHARAAAWIRPDHIEAVLMSASLLNAEGQHDLAVETYAQVPPTAPEFYLAEMGRAETLFSSGKTDAALEVMQSLAKAHPRLLAVQTAYAEMLRRQDRFEDATHAYDAAIALLEKPGPRDWGLFFSRGICHERQKHWDQAEADMRRALELSPDQPQVLNYLGYSYLELNRNLDEALSLIQRAVAAQPDSGYIVDSLAWAYFRLGHHDEALEPMERASLLEPVDPVVTDHLGDVYWAVGRKLEAQFQWRRALSFGPGEKEAERIRRKLEIGLDRVLAEEGAKPLSDVKAAQN